MLPSASLPDDTSQRMRRPHFLPPAVAGLVSCESLLDTSQLREKERERERERERDKLIGKSVVTIHAEQTNCSDILHWTTIINRWFIHMLDSRYLNHLIKKAFITATPGCTEDRSKLFPPFYPKPRGNTSPLKFPCLI